MGRAPNNEMRTKVLEALAEGLRPSEVASRLGCSVSLVNYYGGSRPSAAPPVSRPVTPPEARVTLSEDAPLPPLGEQVSGSDVLGETLRAVLGERDAASSASDRLRAAELLLRHAGGLKSESAWSPEPAVWKAFLAEAYAECLGGADEPR